ncbi:hypothetical protein [Methanococcus aeolicus]|uniref:Uncharacterized protein n=1 Tax=Methanococcus aeolicus (strain ATCC BAA-1280 / DSM 17508 / OCM 812 / Nankai-3) TaxID=419665 RepID=A6UVB2_META3|nr:hypothetical protein [Methanococcus aeolicus]ABR56434.1 conserved hypothetical protein [Methanococcus aeolicus Nankai-3]UXM84435.1 hypothetical protein N6C89_06755 [Methanococcus aeolicus]
MIFDSDVLIGTIILMIGMGYWTVSLTEHNDVYMGAVQNEYQFDKGISTMELLASSGVLQDAVLLYYFDEENGALKNKSIQLLNESIRLNNYKLQIDNNTILSKNFNGSSSYYIIATVTLNRSEGWYVIYGDENDINISNKRYIDYSDAISKYNTNIRMPVYYSKNTTSSKVKLYIGG